MRLCDSKTKLYKSWQCMKRRCLNPDPHHKKYYDGISICNDWLCFKNFKKWALSNGYVEGYTIERKNIYKGYYPNNCCWIPSTLQNINKRNKSHLIIDGVDKSFTEWANEYGIRENTIRMRIKYGFTGMDLLKPSRKYSKEHPYKKGVVNH